MQSTFRLAYLAGHVMKVWGAIHSTKIPTGSTGKRGPPQKVDPFFRNFSGWTEPIHWVLDRNFRKFWLNGSRPCFSQAHVLFWINTSCAEESFVFFRRRKSLTVNENKFKSLRGLCKWYRQKLHVPCHSKKVLRSLIRGTQKLVNSSWSM